MLKSRRLTALLSQSLTPLAPPIDTFTPSSFPDTPHSLSEQAQAQEQLADTAKLPPPHTPKIVMAILLTGTGSLLAASSLNANYSTSYSLALSRSVSQLSTSAGSEGGGGGTTNIGSPGAIVGSLANGAIHLSDLSPKPRVYASFAANAWRSYTRAVTSGDLFDDAVDPTISWIAVENEESTIVVKAVSSHILLALVGERGAPVGLLYARASAMASTLCQELKGFSFE
ncbi:uncharacterized protein V1513DRAFT_177931 [Lipomyces chichibuensis]|uniref:uncharacterized protein n=1 Tax=Lipomyces chichibuensis TaxID=1546026 RepID=UPI003343D8A6